MIVGFSRYGTGGGRGPVGYLTQAANPDGTERSPAPEVLRGHPDLVRGLIDAVPFARTYTSGVLSFMPGEVIPPAMEAAIMDGFERVAFAGLSPDRYSILWVRHTHAGHHELHFVTPRMELASGKSLNIHPPGRVSQQMFDTFRSMVNAEYGLADPDDPTRARDVRVPHYVAKRQAEATRRGQGKELDLRETLTKAVRQEAEAGRIRDQAGVVRYLKRRGYAVPRQGADYVTVLDPQTGKRVRLKGSLYWKEGWHVDAPAVTGVRYGVPDPARAAALADQLAPMVAARALFHQRRYGVEAESEAQQERRPGQAVEELKAYMVRHLGAEALHTVWQPRRQRARAARQGQGQDRGGFGDDRDGATIARRLAAFGSELQRARQRVARAVAALDRAGGRLDQAGRSLTASAAVALDPVREREWWAHYYGRDLGPER
jgi:hypothetical protein